MQPALKPWQRILGSTIAWTVQLVVWAIPSAILLTGIGLWLDWHALARGGTEATARIQACELKRSGGIKFGSGTHFYACTYTYRTTPDAPAHQGYFQSQRGRQPGDAEPIRFLPQRPEVSAAAETLRHPSITAGGMIVVGLALLAWTVRGARAKRAT